MLQNKRIIIFFYYNLTKIFIGYNLAVFCSTKIHRIMFKTRGAKNTFTFFYDHT